MLKTFCGIINKSQSFISPLLKNKKRGKNLFILQQKNSKEKAGKLIWLPLFQQPESQARLRFGWWKEHLSVFIKDRFDWFDLIHPPNTFYSKRTLR